jgi:hypothetical protein
MSDVDFSTTGKAQPPTTPTTATQTGQTTPPVEITPTETALEPIEATTANIEPDNNGSSRGAPKLFEQEEPETAKTTVELYTEELEKRKERRAKISADAKKGTEEVIAAAKKVGSNIADVKGRRKKRAAGLTKLANEQEENKFQRWFKKISKNLNIYEDPDNPKHNYDYRAFYKKYGTDRDKEIIGKLAFPIEFQSTTAGK